MKLASLIPLAALCLTACSSSEPRDTEVVTHNVVTFEGTAQGKSNFSFQVANDSPLIYLSANWTPPSSIKTGQRMLISYVCSNPLASETITLKSAVNCPGGIIRQSTNPTLSDIPFSVITAWRSGSYINLRIAATLNDNPVKIALLYSPKAASSTSPKLYLNLSQEDALSPDAYRRETYLSFQCSPLWSLPSVTSLTLITSSNNDFITFTK